MDDIKKPVNLGFAGGLPATLVLGFFLNSMPLLGLAGAFFALAFNRQSATQALRAGEYLTIATYAGGGIIAGIASTILHWLLRPLIGALL
ncbi:hypothetical protein [Maricaulis sp.]|uniref:hypothetical protein n=1 Tax=Maricaulis sp. TaxID=1486257 RepID=UPI002B26A02B|nr:hypothetical protein [Maricaulis sp.]